MPSPVSPDTIGLNTCRVHQPGRTSRGSPISKVHLIRPEAADLVAGEREGVAEDERENTPLRLCRLTGANGHDHLPLLDELVDRQLGRTGERRIRDLAVERLLARQARVAVEHPD